MSLHLVTGNSSTAKAAVGNFAARFLKSSSDPKPARSWAR
jgi:hypothetical protein